MTFLFKFCVLLSVVLCGVGCAKKVLKKPVASRQYIVADKTAVLATITNDGKPQSVAPAAAIGMHAPPAAELQFIFSARGGGVVYSVEKGGKTRVVHNDAAGKEYTGIGMIAISPDGRRVAYGALVDGKWRMVVDGKEGAAFNTIKAPVFSPDGKHIAYQAMAGEKWYLILDAIQNEGTPTRYVSLEFSADSSKISYIDAVDDNGKGRLVVSDTAFKKLQIVENNVSILKLNSERTHFMAVIKSDTEQRIIESSFDRLGTVKKDLPYDKVSSFAFGPDGITLAYVAEKNGKRMLILNNKVDNLPEGELVELPAVNPDNKVASALMSSARGTFLQQFFTDAGNNAKTYEEATCLTYNKEGYFHAFAARNGKHWFIVVNGTEGPKYDRVVSPMFSPDGKFVVYRARKDGKRFVVVADTNGATLKTHPAYEQVFGTIFTADGKSVAYGVKDGQKLIWKVEAL